MDAMIQKVTIEECRIFYGIDRELYTILVMELCRNPLDSIQVMAFWLWLERLGICKVISTILSLSPSIIDQLADEAMVCINCLKNRLPSSYQSNESLALTQCLMQRSVTLRFFENHQTVILDGVRRLLKDVYIPALSDILEIAQRDFGRRSTQSTRSQGPTSVIYQPRAQPSYEDPLSLNFSTLNIHGNPSPSISSSSAASSSSSSTSLSTRAPSSSRAIAPIHPITSTLAPAHNPVAARTYAPTPALAPIPTPRNRARDHDMAEYTRTMFVTFSKGYPVTEAEVRHHFTVLLGNCIESLYMQDVPPHQQPLFARIVFRDQYFITRILNGETKAKFTINGKHVWMRRFVPRGTTYPCGCPSTGHSVCRHHN